MCCATSISGPSRSRQVQRPATSLCCSAISGEGCRFLARTFVGATVFTWWTAPGPFQRLCQSFLWLVPSIVQRRRTSRSYSVPRRTEAPKIQLGSCTARCWRGAVATSLRPWPLEAGPAKLTGEGRQCERKRNSPERRRRRRQAPRRNSALTPRNTSYFGPWDLWIVLPEFRPCSISCTRARLRSPLRHRPLWLESRSLMRSPHARP
mmetsp:Transcript_14038/g.41223  ORF Transcript_14038/g.41223 Transcript_14038/m.41223 type:complete len:207 (+) Transcript_14038:386-1006(+)